jgi:hypothetical protein
VVSFRPHHARALRWFRDLAAERHSVHPAVVAHLVDAGFITAAPKRKLHRITLLGHERLARYRGVSKL